MAKSFTECEAKPAMYKDQILKAVAESYLNSLDGRVVQDNMVVIDITEEVMNDNNNVAVPTNVACDASCNKYLHYGNKVVLFRRVHFYYKKFFFILGLFPKQTTFVFRKTAEEDLQLGLL